MKILLASDGSDFSLTAARRACELFALESGSQIHIISVVEPVAPVSHFGSADEYLVLAQKAAAGAAAAAAEETLDTVLGNLDGKDVIVETSTPEGNPKSVVVDFAEEWNADLIVTGSHGRGFWGRMLMGSVSDAIVKHAPCSVLVVR